MKPAILVQLDTDAHPSVFDSVVALDSGAEHLLRYGGIEPSKVRDLVHGALFTRGPSDLHRTAIFVGGSDVSAGEAVLQAVTESFFGPFRVSVLMDSSGSNTTAAAAVLAALRGFGGSLHGVRSAVLGATGPVGQRVARLLAREGAEVAVGSRRLDRARSTAEAIAAATGHSPRPFATGDTDDLAEGLHGVSLVIAAGAAGAVLLPAQLRAKLSDLKVAIDLNAVPPAGIEGIEAGDKATDREGVSAWGALGVGGTKMKIHRKAIQTLFESNDKVLDAEDVLAIGKALG